MKPSNQTLLRVDASLQPNSQSASKTLADHLEQQIQPNQVEKIDLSIVNPPAINGAFLQDVMSENSSSNPSVQLANEWIEKLKSCDALIISSPMYNFGMPAQLKTFFDYVLRAGTTFEYTENGPRGLLADKPVYLALASGGDYREGDLAKLNFLDGHLHTLLNFIGLNDIQTFHAAGMAMGEPEQVIRQAKQEIEKTIAQNQGATYVTNH